MPDWTKAMTQTFEYYIVDPGTWKDTDRLDTVLSSKIERDSEADTLGSASIDVTGLVGECYIRIYLVTIQNGVTEKHPLGTFLVQTPESSYDGRYRSVTMDAYTPLLELKENLPPIGYTTPKGANIMTSVYQIVRERVRAPIVEPKCDDTLNNDFVANTDDTWLTYTSDLSTNAKYEVGLDDMGRVLYLPSQDAAALQPVWEFNDDNSSILYPDITMKHELFGIPNRVEVIYSKDSENYTAVAVNDDPDSPTSTINRGREITYRDTNPSFPGEPTNAQIREYATKLLKTLSTAEYTITFSHGYCPVRLGDCVMLNYDRAGITNVKARIVRQSISCEPGCKVQTTATFTKQLWG